DGLHRRGRLPGPRRQPRRADQAGGHGALQRQAPRPRPRGLRLGRL
ncbi:MAG: diguanylate cyclase/phosphodiesterase (GGDEF & EAL domains) with PAS/PAC sensor(s), partial [uncultured Acetobacteraceae bacterium]